MALSDKATIIAGASRDTGLDAFACNALAQPFITPDVRAVLLVGSHARGDAGEFSDIDLKLLLRAGATLSRPASHLIDGFLVTVSGASPDEVEEWFTNPAVSVTAIQGIRDGRILYDPDGVCAQAQRRAREYMWDAAIQAKANVWVSAEMIGWIEETYKGLEGLRRHDIGRMLNARHGFSWGLSRVMQVYLGVLYSSDNGIHAELTGHVSAHWATLRDAAFGICNPDGAPIALEDQIVAGLELYVETARMVDAAILPEHRVLVDHTVAAITRETATRFSNSRRAC